MSVASVARRLAEGLPQEGQLPGDNDGFLLRWRRWISQFSPNWPGTIGRAIATNQRRQNTASRKAELIWATACVCRDGRMCQPPVVKRQTSLSFAGDVVDCGS